MDKKKKTRGEYLSASADILCIAAFKLVESGFVKMGAEEIDAKRLKEICSVVKEVIAVSSALEKDGESGESGISVFMSGETRECAV